MRKSLISSHVKEQVQLTSPCNWPADSVLPGDTPLTWISHPQRVTYGGHIYSDLPNQVGISVPPPPPPHHNTTYFLEGVIVDEVWPVTVDQGTEGETILETAERRLIQDGKAPKMNFPQMTENWADLPKIKTSKELDFNKHQTKHKILYKTVYNFLVQKKQFYSSQSYRTFWKLASYLLLLGTRVTARHNNVLINLPQDSIPVTTAVLHRANERVSE